MKPRSPTKLALLLIVAILGLLVAIVLFGLFGPTPPIEVSEETTYVLGPLDENGNVDYRAALEVRYGNISPEENAARHYVLAFDPEGDLKGKAREQLLRQLDLPEETWEDAYLEYIEDFADRHPELVAETRVAQGLSTLPGNVNVDDERIMWHWWDITMARPWKEKEFPLFAAWLEEQQVPLDHIRNGAAMQHCYFPIIFEKPNDPSNTLLSVSLNSLQPCRDAARELSMRAMWQAGEGNIDASLSDIRALLALSRHTSEQPSLVANLVAIAIREMALTTMTSLLHHARLSPELLAQLAKEFEEFPRDSMANEYRGGERLMMIDFILAMSQGRTDGDEFGESVPKLPGIDWNIVLRRMNEYYDRIEALAEMPPGEARTAQADELERELEQQSLEVKSIRRWTASLFSRRSRSELMAVNLVSLLLPAMTAISNVEDRCLTREDLARVAIALARHRAAHDEYPTELAQLVPEFLPEMPLDRFSGKPLLYQRTADGYRLYSVGRNGKNNNGLDATVDYNLDHDLHDDISLHQPRPIPKPEWEVEVIDEVVEEEQ